MWRGSLCLRVDTFKYSKIHILVWRNLRFALNGITDSKFMSFEDKKSPRYFEDDLSPWS